MKKIFLILITLAGIASATEVTLCQFKNGIGYETVKLYVKKNLTQQFKTCMQRDGGIKELLKLKMRLI